MTMGTPPPPEIPDSRWRQSLRRRLLTWFRAHGRDLPWRRTRTLYHVWVSEIMLQQTQVVTVVPFFQRFIKRFPDITSLASAKEDEILRLWEGLGYYRRARNLHRAAQQIVQNYDGQFPEDFSVARSLPGIGRYTAGAILSIARDHKLPILEANTVRVFSRLLAFRGVPSEKTGQQLLWSFSESLLPRKGVGDINQALMELGSEICVPRAPNCATCPVHMLCAAYRQGAQALIPAKKPRPPIEDVTEAAIVIQRGSRVLLRRHSDQERWAGLWDFPRFAATTGNTVVSSRELIDNAHQLTGMNIEPLQHLTTLQHAVTRFRITLQCHLARYVSGRKPGDHLCWRAPDELEQLPLNVTGRKIGRLLANLSK
ncbi:MAG: A/G-specific adenine glycosylase [Planctomycetota bacterium]|nr:A/G-specific adenine glycosylase [Planctomycetota bacterium]